VTLAEGETHADGARTLGFDVRLDDFRMEYYEQEGTPSSYESDVVLLADGREVGRGTATVNHQVTYHGTSLGQSSWGLSAVRLTVPGEPEALTTPLEQVPDEHGDGTAWVPAGQGNIHMLADGKAAIVVTNFAPESVEEDGELLGMTGEYPRSPAVAVQLITSIDDGKHETHDLGWIGLGKARTMAGHTVRFDDLVYVSTLSARRDPGLPLVWAGFILVSLGMIITFYVRPRAFLVELRPAGPVTEVRTAPAGRELLEADRHLIEAACGSPLRALQAAPRSATPTRRG
jgi:cytochrome c biogenesis protein